MSIRFSCSNPDCSRVIRAPRSAAGKKARCPSCGRLQFVPPDVPEAEDTGALLPPGVPSAAPRIADAADDIRPIEEPDEIRPIEDIDDLRPLRRPRASGPAGAPTTSDDLLRLFADDLDGPGTPAQRPRPHPSGSRSLPPAPVTPRPPEPSPLSPPVTCAPATSAARQASDAQLPFGQYAAELFGSFAYAGRALGTILPMVLVFIGLMIVARLLLWGWGLALEQLQSVLLAWVSLAAIVPLLVGTIFGYFLRFGSNVVDDAVSQDGDGVAIAPGFHPGRLLLTWLRYVGVTIVYTWPIVTIPLLPIGLLGAGAYDDARAFNLYWAARLAAKRPGHLALLWVVMILWLIPALIALFLVSAILTQILERANLGDGGVKALQFAGATVLLSLYSVFIAGWWRSAGILGRHSRSLMERNEYWGGWVSLVAAIFGGLVIWLAVAGASLAALGAWTSGTVARLGGGGSATAPPTSFATGWGSPPSSASGIGATGASGIPGAPPRNPVPLPPTTVPPRMVDRYDVSLEWAALEAYGREIARSQRHGGSPPVPDPEDAEARTAAYFRLHYWGRYRTAMDLNSAPTGDLARIVVLDPASAMPDKLLGLTAAGSVVAAPREQITRAYDEGLSLEQVAAASATPGTPPRYPDLGTAGPSTPAALPAAVAAVEKQLAGLQPVLRQYAMENQLRYPTSLVDLLAQGFTLDRQAVTSPAGSLWGLVPGLRMASASDSVILFDAGSAAGWVVVLRLNGRTEAASLDSTLGREVQDLVRRYPPETLPQRIALATATVTLPPRGPRDTAPASAPPEVRSRAALSALHEDLQRWAHDHGGLYPDTLEALLRPTGAVTYTPSASLLHSPADPSRPLVYVAGQATGFPRRNLLAYDPVPQRRGTMVLYTAVTVAGMTETFPTAEALADRLREMGAPESLLPGLDPAGALAADPSATEPPMPPAGAPRPIPSRVRVERDSDAIVWIVPGAQSTSLSPDHPLLQHCRVVKRLEVDDASGLIGVDVGPRCAGPDDIAYLNYRERVTEQFSQIVSGSGGAVDRRPLTEKVGDATYDRLLGMDRRRTEIATVLLGVQEGRAVAYWYTGGPGGYPAFRDAAGKARWDDATVDVPE